MLKCLGFIASLSIWRETESNAFCISWNKSHSSLSCSFASSVILLRIYITLDVKSPGKPAKFGPLRIGFFVKVSERHVARIFVIYLRNVSKRAIGLREFRVQSHSADFGIGYIWLHFYLDGIFPDFKHNKPNFLKKSCVSCLFDQYISNSRYSRSCVVLKLL